MANISEISYAGNVIYFKSLISSVTAIGTNNNPSKESNKFSAFQNLLTSSKTSLNTLNTAQSTCFMATGAKEQAFY